MPFKSQKQRRFMYSQHPEMAKRWEAETPKGKPLPESAGDNSNEGKKNMKNMSKEAFLSGLIKAYKSMTGADAAPNPAPVAPSVKAKPIKSSPTGPTIAGGSPAEKKADDDDSKKKPKKNYMKGEPGQNLGFRDNYRRNAEYRRHTMPAASPVRMGGRMLTTGLTGLIAPAAVGLGTMAFRDNPERSSIRSDLNFASGFQPTAHVLEHIGYGITGAGLGALAGGLAGSGLNAISGGSSGLGQSTASYAGYGVGGATGLALGLLLANSLRKKDNAARMGTEKDFKRYGNKLPDHYLQQYRDKERAEKKAAGDGVPPSTYNRLTDDQLRQSDRLLGNLGDRINRTIGLPTGNMNPGMQIRGVNTPVGNIAANRKMEIRGVNVPAKAVDANYPFGRGTKLGPLHQYSRFANRARLLNPEEGTATSAKLSPEGLARATRAGKAINTRKMDIRGVTAPVGETYVNPHLVAARDSLSKSSDVRMITDVAGVPQSEIAAYPTQVGMLGGLGGAALGAGVGGLAGALFAPRRGKDSPSAGDRILAALLGATGGGALGGVGGFYAGRGIGNNVINDVLENQRKIQRAELDASPAGRIKDWWRN